MRDCKQYVGDSASCKLALINDHLFYQKHGCNEFLTGQERKDCLASVGAYVASQKTATKVEREDTSLLCDDWGAACLSTCPP